MSYNDSNNKEISDRSWIVTLLLAIFLPVHRFYVGKIGTGILYWLTAWGFGIWYIVDIVLILLDAFTDNQGRKLRK
ncbi:TM2 domain-containing protein [Brachyspira sp.]|uniref:TM2 domain-containing protein n=1 Tax=Brachyspira sp. TaxID=1977261 RepID=UPI003D7CDD58